MSTFIIKFNDIITSTYQSYFTENPLSILPHILYELKWSATCLIFYSNDARRSDETRRRNVENNDRSPRGLSLRSSTKQPHEKTKVSPSITAPRLRAIGHELGWVSQVYEWSVENAKLQ